MGFKKKIAITGCRGFIGTNFLKYFSNKYKEYDIIGLDSETYAAQPLLHGTRSDILIEKVDIRDHASVSRFFFKHKPDHVIHFAASSHVCRSIEGPKEFIETNINGTFHLIEEFKELWKPELESHRFHHISTDEVYGVAKDDFYFNEMTSYDPKSPYAASKASSDHVVKAYFNTYGMNTVITNCSNNFGPNQHEEKLIPKTIKSLIKNEEITVYGHGNQIRDWIYVLDHCDAIDLVFHKAKKGDQFVVGGNLELRNLQVINKVIDCYRSILNKKELDIKMIHTNDRPTDDQRYAIDNTKITSILGWSPNPSRFEDYLNKSIVWYWDKWRGI